RCTSGNIFLKSLAAIQWVAQCLPLIKPVEANKKAPTHRLATSAPLVYCRLIQGKKSVFLSMIFSISPSTAGTTIRPASATSLISASVYTEYLPPATFTSFVRPTNCTLNKGDLPIRVKYLLTSVKTWRGPSTLPRMAPSGTRIAIVFIIRDLEL